MINEILRQRPSGQEIRRAIDELSLIIIASQETERQINKLVSVCTR